MGTSVHTTCVLILLMAAGALHSAANPKVLAVTDIRESIPTDLHDLAIPPEPIPLDWSLDVAAGNVVLDRGLEVTHIRFNHSPSHDQDAMEIRWCFEEELFHADSNFDGEYFPDDKRNDPSAYVNGITPKIQVVIRSKQPDPGNPGQFMDDMFIGRSVIWATAEPSDPNVGVAFLSLKRKRVFFVNGESRDSDQPGASRFVTFDVEGALPRGFNVYKWTFTFHLEGVWDAAGNLIDAQDGQGQPIESKFDKTAELHAYTTIGLPSVPWNETRRALQTKPWVNAIAFTGYRCQAFGASSEYDVAEKVIRYLHGGHRIVYDHVLGASYHGALTQDRTGNVWGFFNLTLYILGGRLCNCHDQSWAVASLVNVAARRGAEVEYLRRFGYIHATRAVGGITVNNPYFMRLQVWPFPVVHQDATYTLFFAAGTYFWHRTHCATHSWVRIGGLGSVGDACFGPTVPSQGLRLDPYLNATRDTSTVPEQSVPELDSAGVLQFVPVGAAGDRRVVTPYLLGRKNQR